jgi:hypothetical protein
MKRPGKLWYLLLPPLAVGTCAADSCSPSYDVTPSELQGAMRASSYGNEQFAPWCDAYSEHEPFTTTLTESCHTQGITVGQDRFTVACMGTSGDKTGWVQSFEKSTAFVPAAIGSARRLYSAPFNHPNVGNGLFITQQDAAGQSTTYTVYPVVNASGDGDNAGGGTIVEIRKFDTHERTCSFRHDIKDAYGRSSLGAISAVGIDNAAYIAACGWNCDEFYIYGLAHPESGDCGPQLVSKLRARGTGADTSPIVDAGAGDRNWGFYQGVALIVNEQDEVFMVGTHQSYMDTWQISGFRGSSRTFRKLSKFKWDGSWSVDGHTYFQQGVSLEWVASDRLAIWLSPHDFRTRDNGRYVRVYRCERQL